MPHKTPDEAREAIREFVKYDREKQELNGFSDEAYAWGFGLGNVVFRRGKFNVYVSTVADVDDDADARTLSQSERDARMKSEMKRLSQEFARLVSVALIDVP